MKLRFRSGPAGIALLAALVFVLFRVIYRVIFGGVVLGSTFLPSLPSITLIGPFSHVILFGPVTLEGIAASAISALPFAGIILVFGLVVSFLDPTTLLAQLTKKETPALLRAFAISLSSLPKLLTQVQSIRSTAALRGVRKSRYIAVPILGTAIERAMALATNLELSYSEPKSESKALGIAFENYEVGRIPFGSGEFLGPGLMMITGPNGSGKTTFLRSIAGLVSSDGRFIKGELNRFSPDGIPTVSYVQQDPRMGFLGETVGQELQLRGFKPDKFSWPIERNLADLSQGEATLFAIDMGLAADPRFLLLDEPFNGLDKAQRERLNQRLISAAEKSLVIVTGPTFEFELNTDVRVLHISATGISEGEYLYRKERATGSYPAPLSDFALTKEDIHLEVAGTVLLSSGRISLNKGSINSLQGANGVGKTSLLKHLVTDHVYLVPENFSELFLADSLDAELALSDKLAGCKKGLSKATFFSLLAGAENQNSDQMLATHPRDLSFATSFALALAIQIVRKPAVLLIDEPGKGFDPVAKQASCEALRCVAETGTAVLFATHDDEFVAIAHRKLEIRDAKLREVSFEPVAN